MIVFVNSTATIKNIEITNYNNGGVINVDTLSKVELNSVAILGFPQVYCITLNVMCLKYSPPWCWT